MNWYRIIKFADSPLPSYEGVPEDLYNEHLGIDKIRNSMSESLADKEKKTHPSLNYLGSGNVGIAYNIGENDNVVIKYTGDLGEYKNAKKILQMQEERNGRNIPGIVTVFHAEVIGDGIYKIVSEKVKQLSAVEMEIVQYLDFIPRCDIEHYSFERCMSIDGAMVSRDKKIIIDELNIDINIVKDVYKKYEKLLRNLALYRIPAFDLSNDNIGINNDNDYVALDLGGLF